MRDGIEEPAQRGPGFAVHRVGVRGGDDVGASMMNAGVNGESCPVERMLAFDDFAFRVDEHQVRDANLAEVNAERVDPEVVGMLWITRGNVPCDAFIEAEFGEKPERGCEALFAMAALFFDAGEFGEAGNAVGFCRRGGHDSPRGENAASITSNS